jgi:hypothetical protein
MAGFYRRLRQLVARGAFAAATASALVPSVDAQWLPFGAAPPGEIVQRLRAEGFVLIRPLERRDTVYLADVAGGPAGHERLVIDAWSGEILQRFVARRGGLVPEGGEFSEPPPLGPPPARDFREGNYGNGSEGPLPPRDFREGNYGNRPEGPPSGYEAQPRARAKSRPAATARKGVEPRQMTPAAQPAEPQNAGTGSPSGTPAAAAPSAATPPTAATPAAAPAHPNPAEPAKAGTSPTNASSEPKENRERPAAAASSNPPTSAWKPEKKVNDVPVNPLE